MTFSRMATVLLVGIAGALVHCSSSGSGAPGPLLQGTPLHHFPAGASCRATRLPGIVTGDGGGSCAGDAGTFCMCGSDAECSAGTNGRCIVNGNAGPHCDYDMCFTSSDCASGKSCGCGDLTSESANVCVPSNCSVDTDCGPEGYCSPTLDETCGPYGGEYAGVYCHTPQDECFNDSDCGADGASFGSSYCVYFLETGKWACHTGQCAG